MPTYLTPGIYIEETPGGPRPIEAVGTSTAGFIGEAPDSNANRNQPIAINSWTQFLKEYAPKGSSATPLALGVFGFFLNGGSRCYVLNVGKDSPVSGPKGVDQFETIAEISIVAAPGYSDSESFEALLAHCEKMKDRVAILDCPRDVPDIDLLTQVATASTPGLRPRQSDKGYGSFYFPWISVQDPLSSEQNALVDAPPSGHIAGIYARTDSTRGVHKAPANEPVRGALDVTYKLTPDEQGKLNSNGVNTILFFSTEDITVWGARTLAASASEWRYINVRRLFTMIETSIGRSTRWVAFEPNDEPLWNSIKRDIEAFLTLLWCQGALMGKTPDEAFSVRCDEETNPPEVVNAGMLVIEIGIASVKPAAFSSVRISQGAAGAEVEYIDDDGHDDNADLCVRMELDSIKVGASGFKADPNDDDHDKGKGKGKDDDDKGDDDKGEDD